MVQGYTQEGFGSSSGWYSFGSRNFISEGYGTFTGFSAGFKRFSTYSSRLAYEQWFTCTDSVNQDRGIQEKNPDKKERDLSNLPEKYNTMCVQGKPEEHHSDLNKVPGRILDNKMVKVFRLDMCFVEEHFEMIQYVEPGKKPKWGYFPKEGHPQAVIKFEGTKATPEFLPSIAYEVYVKNVTFGLLHQWLTDMGMSISANILRNWLKKGKKYLDQLIVVLKSKRPL